MTPEQNRLLMRVISGRLERPVHTHTDVLIANAIVERDTLLKAMKMAVADGTNITEIKACLKQVIQKVEEEV